MNTNKNPNSICNIIEKKGVLDVVKYINNVKDAKLLHERNSINFTPLMIAVKRNSVVFQPL